ncbi:glycosyltransferase family 4 protein [Butyrivibrio sp. FC2001]|uniref:glycosyltransferase family 4 protein n=1 Tax=Butyrivibrio sp. FC2001 TaxID=1280671 RepID=UPI00040901AF|nr:glycosyltransferase family 4 protein [Butyrivibrio sp. FC2001]
MNILYISDADNKYGASKSMLYTIKGLKQQYGNDIKIFLLIPYRLRNNRKMYEEYCEVVICKVFGQYFQNRPYNKWIFPIKLIIKFLEYILGIINLSLFLDKEISFEEIDIIHSNSSRDDTGIRLARKYNKPLVWHIREYGDKDFNCFCFRNDYIDLMNDNRATLVAVSEAVRKHWINKGISPNKIITIYNGIELTECKDYANLDNSKIRILMLGGISDAKCQKHLIEAIALLDDSARKHISIDIIGDGNKKYFTEIKNLVKVYGLNSIISFKGYIPNPERYIKQYDVGVICSKSEAFGRVTVEYMMNGLLVIAPDSGANQEIIQDGVEGFIYKWGDYSELALCIDRAISDKNILSRYGKNAHHRAMTEFSLKKYIEKIYSLYMELV